ncbi:MAG: glycine cleavage system aminomethyltransferase GcvT [Planctomycetes bacterium]|nr:glycine cleavage system aminomethyltransferase GcvT [Planctomycetota bacterium]
MLKRTPLFEAHVALGARMVDFGGWEMPVQYAGIIEESKATRTAVGIFDIAHMGRIEVIGRDHVAAVDWVVTCDVQKLGVGRCKYGILSTDRGTAIDDVLVYRDVDRTQLVVNAGNRDVDIAHVREQIAAKGFDAKAIDCADVNEPAVSETVLGVPQQMLSLQGRNSEKLLQRIVGTSTDLSKLGYYRHTRGTLLSIPAIISRTGYTGEDGFEFFFDRREATRIWDVLMAQGRDLGLAPIGLGARDALRTEAGMPLYGHELDLNTTPVEARLDFGVQLAKAPFLGQAALVAQKAAGPKKVLVGFEVDTKRVPRNGFPLLKDGVQVGYVASGTWSPTLEKNIGMGFVTPNLVEPGSTFDVDIRGKVHGCTVVPLPFYKRPK